MRSTVRLLGILLVSVSLCAMALPQTIQQSEELSRLDSLLNDAKTWKPENVERAKTAILEMAQTTRDPAFAERIAQAIRAGELAQAEDIIKAIPEAACGDAFTALLDDEDPLVVQQGLAFQEKVKDVDALLRVLKKLLERGHNDTLRRTADILEGCSLSRPQCEDLVQFLVNSPTVWGTSCVADVLRSQQLTDSQHRRVLKTLFRDLEAQNTYVVAVIGHEILQWDNSHQAKERVFDAIVERAAGHLLEPLKSYGPLRCCFDVMEECAPTPSDARHLLDLAEQQGVKDPWTTLHIKRLSSPPLSLSPDEELEVILQEELPSALNGLLDLSCMYPRKESVPGVASQSESGPVVSEERGEFLIRHKTRAIELLLNKLQTSGDPYAALLLGWSKEQKALPLLRFWYLHARDDDYGWEGQPALHFYTESYRYRYAYEKAIQNISGLSLEEVIRLDDTERAWLTLHLRAMLPDSELGNLCADPSPELAAFILWRLEPETARSELLQIFREDSAFPRSARALMAEGILDYLLKGVSKQEEFHRLLGEPDEKTDETSRSCLQRQYAARLGGWKERWIYRFGQDSDDGRSYTALCVFFDGDRSICARCFPRAADPDNPNHFTLAGLLPERTWPPKLLIEGFKSPSPEVRLLAIDLVSPEAGKETLLPHLKRLLEDPDEHVRREAGSKIKVMEDGHQNK